MLLVALLVLAILLGSAAACGSLTHATIGDHALRFFSNRRMPFLSLSLYYNLFHVIHRTTPLHNPSLTHNPLIFCLQKSLQQSDSGTPLPFKLAAPFLTGVTTW